jgi:hypothetical protein
VLADDVDVSEHIVPGLTTRIPSLFVKATPPHPPSWLGYLAPHVQGGLTNLYAASSGAVLIVEAGGRVFAVTFGQGRHLLNTSAFEPDFGLAQRARMRAVTRVSRPAGVRPPWRSRWSWSLRLLTIDSIRSRIQPIGGLGRPGSSLRLGLRSSRCARRNDLGVAARCRVAEADLSDPLDRELRRQRPARDELLVVRTQLVRDPRVGGLVHIGRVARERLPVAVSAHEQPARAKVPDSGEGPSRPRAPEDIPANDNNVDTLTLDLHQDRLKRGKVPVDVVQRRDLHHGHRSEGGVVA